MEEYKDNSNTCKILLKNEMQQSESEVENTQGRIILRNVLNSGSLFESQ